jgi:hypothetical protein
MKNVVTPIKKRYITVSPMLVIEDATIPASDARLGADEVRLEALIPKPLRTDEKSARRWFNSDWNKGRSRTSTSNE